MKVVAEESNALISAADALDHAMGLHDFATTEEHMHYCADTLRSLMDEVRARAETLETLVADSHWPLPKYREMLFIK